MSGRARAPHASSVAALLFAGFAASAEPAPQIEIDAYTRYERMKPGSGARRLGAERRLNAGGGNHGARWSRPAGIQ